MCQDHLLLKVKTLRILVVLFLSFLIVCLELIIKVHNFENTKEKVVRMTGIKPIGLKRIVSFKSVVHLVCKSHP